MLVVGFLIYGSFACKEFNVFTISGVKKEYRWPNVWLLHLNLLDINGYSTFHAGFEHNSSMHPNLNFLV